MKIALFGASGMIGQRILDEALSRGHEVTAIVRKPENITTTNPNVTVKQGDALDPAQVAELVPGHDVVVSSISPNETYDPQILPNAAKSFVEALPKAGVSRLIVVGGAGRLEVAPGQRTVDQDWFPEAWRPLALSHIVGLDTYRASDLDWTFFSPANIIEPGERTEKFRLGKDTLITDENGDSRISAEDYAIALVDELEHPQHVRQAFTIGY